MTGVGTTARSPLALAAAVAALIAALLACYLPTPGNYWISYDNPQLIRQEPRIRALTLEGSARSAALIALATTPHHDLYQPLASLSWAIDYALFGWDKSGFHAHSLALHIGVVLALFFLALRLSGSLPAAFLAALLCGVHPVMVQSVCWTIARTSSLAAIWILIGCHLHLSYALRCAPGSARPGQSGRTGRHHLLVLSTLAFAISMLAKPLPSVVLLPLLIGLWVQRPLRLPVWLEGVPLAGVAIVITLVNLESSNVSGSEAAIVRPWLEVLRNAPQSLALTVANLIWPRDLALHYGYALGGSLIGWRWLGVVGGVGVALFGGAALWRRGERGVLLSVAGFLLLLAPQIAAIRYRDVLTADRYSYIPLVFLALGVASLLAHVFSARRGEQKSWLRPAAIATTLIAVTALGVEARAQSRMWRDEEKLWQRVVSQTPAPLPYLALCKLYALEQRRIDALEACRLAQALAVDAPYASKDAAYPFYVAREARLVAEQWQGSGRPDATPTAATYFALASSTAEEAIARWPDRIDLRYELGRTQLAAGNARRAIATFEAILAIDPADEPSTTYLGVALFEAGDFESALEVLEADPSGGMVEPIRYVTIARIYTAKGQHDLAARANLAWVQAEPSEESAHAAFRASMRAATETGSRGKVDELGRHYRYWYGE